jgi:nucleotide-binding universal stress UspA family protein
MHILIAIHDSSDAEETLRFAAQFAQFAGQTTTILAVVEARRRAPQMEDLLARAGEILGVSQPTTRLRTGDLFREVSAEIRQSGCDLLVVGESRTRHGRSFWPHEGAIQRLVEHAPCPVIVVKGKARGVQRILLCDSGAENSVLSRFTLQVAELLGGEEEVTVLHVMSQIIAGPGVPEKQLLVGASELIEEHAPEGEMLSYDIQLLGRPGIRPQAKIRHGLVVDEILAEARSADYDLVVIGEHRERGWQRYLLDDLAHQILSHLDRPVLVVR